MDKDLRSELTQLQRGWLGHLRAWEGSGETMKAYAEREGLDHRRLYRFRTILMRKGVYREGEVKGGRFVRAHLERPSEPGAMYWIRFRNGCVVEVAGEVSEARLRAIMHTVSALP